MVDLLLTCCLRCVIWPWHEFAVSFLGFPKAKTHALGSHLRAAVGDYASAVCDAARDIPTSTHDLWLGNYLEMIAASQVGPIRAAVLLSQTKGCACGKGVSACDEA